MIFKKKNIIPVIAILSGLTLTGCSSNLTDAEVDDFLVYVSDETTNPDLDFNKFEETILKTLPKIADKEKTSQIINDYIYILYNEVHQYTSYFNVMGDKLDLIKNKLNIDNIDVTMYKEISKESKAIGAILEEMYNKDLMVIDRNNLYTIEVDMDRLIKKFKNYLTTDLIDFMEFRSEENSKPIYNDNADKYDVGLLLERASTSLDYINNNRESTQLSNWQSTAEYYFELILAEYTSQFLDTESTDVKKVSKDYLNELKTVIEDYKTTSIYDDIVTYIELLEKNDYNLEAEEVVLHRIKILNAIYLVEETEAEFDIETEAEVEFDIEVDDSTENNNE